MMSSAGGCARCRIQRPASPRARPAALARPASTSGLRRSSLIFDETVPIVRLTFGFPTASFSEIIGFMRDAELRNEPILLFAFTFHVVSAEAGRSTPESRMVSMVVLLNY